MMLVGWLWLLSLSQCRHCWWGGHGHWWRLCCQCMVWWWWKKRWESEDLREIFEVCVCAHVCVNDYISILNYQYFLIVFATLHASHHHHQRQQQPNHRIWTMAMVLTTTSIVNQMTMMMAMPPPMWQQQWPHQQQWCDHPHPVSSTWPPTTTMTTTTTTSAIWRTSGASGFRLDVLGPWDCLGCDWFQTMHWVQILQITFITFGQMSLHTHDRYYQTTSQIRFQTTRMRVHVHDGQCTYWHNKF